MQQYLRNLVPRIKQLSTSLNKKELFIDQPWILIDENNNQHQYIFKRDSQLIMSFNGKVQMGKWEYIAAANSLLIDRVVDKILLNHTFFDRGVMLLKMDGEKGQPWILANKNIIPDLDVQKYLTQILTQNLKLQNLTVNGNSYYYSCSDQAALTFASSTEFFDDNFEPASAIQIEYRGKIYMIENGKIISSYTKREMTTDKGCIIVNAKLYDLGIGDLVSQNNYAAADGEYRIVGDSYYSRLVIVDGKIITLKSKGLPFNTVLVLLFILLIFICIVIIYRSA